MSKLQELQNRIGYTFEKEGLLRQALTHSSYANEKHMKKHSDNERLEFLGDAVLEIVSSDFLYRDYLLLGKGENQTGGRKRKSILSDALEPVIGAIYLDGGFEPAKKFIHKFILTDIEHKKLFYDSKTILQEVVQGNYKESLHYELISEEGPDHDKQFSVEARIGDKVIGAGTGHTKKAAEQEAAYQALLLLKPKL